MFHRRRSLRAKERLTALAREVSRSLVIGSALISVCSVASSQNIISNPGFEIINFERGPSTTFTGINDGLGSSANDWRVWNNTFGTTTTELIPSTDSITPGGTYMMHINTDGASNGIFQNPGPVSPSFGYIDVFVLRGVVQLTLDGFGQTLSSLSSKTNQWERLGVDLPHGSSIMRLYSSGGGANFYVDNAYLGSTPLPDLPPAPSDVPEPGPIAVLFASSIAGCGVLVRRKRQHTP